MNSTDFLERASDIAFKKLDEKGGNTFLLENPLKAIAIVYTAQGVIDNGGLEYFFESDFPDNPPYQLFIDAYCEIGANEEAEIIQNSLSFFSLPKPELDMEGRRRFLATLPSDYSHEFSQLSGKLCGNSKIWTLLEEYAKNNKNLIGIVGDSQ